MDVSFWAVLHTIFVCKIGPAGQPKSRLLPTALIRTRVCACVRSPRDHHNDGQLVTVGFGKCKTRSADWGWQWRFWLHGVEKKRRQGDEKEAARVGPGVATNRERPKARLCPPPTQLALAPLDHSWCSFPVRLNLCCTTLNLYEWVCMLGQHIFPYQSLIHPQQ